MPRRKTITIDLSTLEFGDSIYELLAEEEQFLNYDMSTLKITIQEEIENKIKDPKTAIQNLERYMAINPNYSDVPYKQNLVKTQTLAKMLGVTRVTLNKWLKDGLLFRNTPNYGRALKAFDPIDVLEQLKKYNSYTKEQDW